MNHIEKESLGLFPTPLYRLPNLSRELGTNIWIKRDDLCGVALGGNKVRKLEYLLHDAKAKGYDLVVTTGAAQSNHAMLTAACALRMGLDCILVLKNRGVTARKGNLILNHLMGVEVRFVDTDSYEDITPKWTESPPKWVGKFTKSPAAAPTPWAPWATSTA